MQTNTTSQSSTLMTEEQPQLGKTELLLKNVRKMPIFRQLIPQEAGVGLTDGHIFQYKDKYCYVKASNS